MGCLCSSWFVLLVGVVLFYLGLVVSLFVGFGWLGQLGLGLVVWLII